VTTLPRGVKIRHLLREEKGVMTLPDRRVKSYPNITKKRLGLDVGKSQKWPCQHLGLFKIEFSTRKKLICSKKVTTLPDLTVYYEKQIFSKI
jgi:hypothetical protein